MKRIFQDREKFTFVVLDGKDTADADSGYHDPDAIGLHLHGTTDKYDEKWARLSAWLNPDEAHELGIYLIERAAVYKKR